MSTFERYQDLISNPKTSFFGNPMSNKLLVSTEGRFQTFYAPFDHINRDAKVVICGITPGKQQALNALEEARKSMLNGDSAEVAKQKAKKFGSFSGDMRPNLIAMLNHIGLDEVLGITNCADLFGAYSNLVHYTSALRNPVFLDGENYSGSPSMVKQPALLRQIELALVEEIRLLGQDCIYVPLGDEVSKVFTYLEAKGLVNPAQVLNGLPHPSGNSVERVHYFLGKKERALLSNRTDADKIDTGKASILAKVKALRAL
ncbi:hypothetical protein [Pseudomonas serbica]|uniref:hypothetical protein n=1 Tax=Pseudomonas serbica TaxID=2965074 RepID=UPI00237A2316|nr:hypothetical protein [Pseudomonas serbica]